MKSAARKIPGVARVVREGDFLGVVAANEWDAIRGADALKVTWSKSETLPDQAKLWEHVRATKVVKEDATSNVGNVAEAWPRKGRSFVRRPTTSPSTRTARSGRHALLPSSRTAS